MQQWTVSEPYLKLKCGLGEGPLYHEARHEFRFVDIWKHKLHFIDVEKGPESLRTVETETAVGVTADLEGSDELIVAATKYGFATMDRTTGKLEYLQKLWENEKDPEKPKRMRLNDGSVDSQGRFWAGAMTDSKVAEPIDEGSLFRLDPDRTFHHVLDHITIPNGIGWNDKDDTMFFTDSPTKNIYAFDFDAATGNISNQRVFFHLEDKVGVPDGFAMDVEGYLWSAVCFGGKVIRISPEGQVVAEILLPSPNITCPAFVGTELFITSMDDGASEYGGCLFRVDVGVRGKPKHKFRLRGR